MNSIRTLCFCLALAALPTVPALAAAQAAAPAAGRGAFVARYCVSCHGRARPAAGVAFDRLDAASVAGHEELWEKAVLKVRAGDMPPAGAPAPDRAARTAWVASLESSLDQVAASRPNPGRRTLRRSLCEMQSRRGEAMRKCADQRPPGEMQRVTKCARWRWTV